MFVLYDTALEADVLNLIKKQLDIDIKSDAPSLMGKWLKSENTSSKESRALATKTRLALGMSPKQYRKTLSDLRRKINIVERRMSAQQWDTIAYGKLPSKAGLLYRKAFKEHDDVRYTAFLESLKTGEVKVNSKTLYPYELIAKILNNKGRFETKATEFYPLYNAMWEQLPNYLSEDFGDAICVLDTSDSMTWEQNALAMKVCISLGIYFAERNQGVYKDHVISFNTYPRFVEIKGDNFVEKVRYTMSNVCTGGSTNIQAVFQLVLNGAIKYSLKQEQIPKRIIIISDMEFDRASSRETNTERLFDIIKKEWAQYGYQIPRLVFWNVNARNDQFPMHKDDAGVQFVSGCNPSIFKTLMGGGEELSAYDLMLEALNDERYSTIII
jgi:hypothetical protein